MATTVVVSFTVKVPPMSVMRPVPPMLPTPPTPTLSAPARWVIVPTKLGLATARFTVGALVPSRVRNSKAVGRLERGPSAVVLMLAVPPPVKVSPNAPVMPPARFRTLSLSTPMFVAAPSVRTPRVKVLLWVPLPEAATESVNVVAFKMLATVVFAAILVPVII